MKRIFILVLLFILGTSYFVHEHVLKNQDESLRDSLSITESVVIKTPKAHPPRAIEQAAYPAPEDTWPYIPPPDYSNETPIPTLPFPTLAPTMNPLDD